MALVDSGGDDKENWFGKGEAETRKEAEKGKCRNV